MKRVSIPRYGDVGVLEIGEGPPPPSIPGGVRIRVRAAGVNFADLLMRMGLYPGAPPRPFVPGYEVAGVVIEAPKAPAAGGSGASGPPLEPGAPVMAVTRFGGYAEEVVTPASKVFPLPAGWSFEEGAAFPVVTLTAWCALSLMARVKRGDRVLVHGIAGGVGLAALQIARSRGARVAGTCGGGEKAKAVRDRGAELAVDPREANAAAALRDWAPGGMDVVLEPRGMRALREDLGLLAPGGRVVLYGASEMAPGRRRKLLEIVRSAPSILAVNPLTLMRRNAGVFGLNLLLLWDREALVREAVAELEPEVGSGALRPVVDRTFPLERAGEAHRYLHDRKNVGKVVLTVGSESQ